MHRKGEAADCLLERISVMMLRSEGSFAMDEPAVRRVSTGSPFEPKVGISRGVKRGRIIAISGTAPLGPDGKTVAKGDAAAQARRCFEIIDVAIRGLGGKRSDIVRTRILLTRMEDWEQVASVHGEFFGGI